MRRGCYLVSSSLNTLKDLEDEYKLQINDNSDDDEIHLNAWEWSDVIRQAAKEWIQSFKGKDSSKIDIGGAYVESNGEQIYWRCDEYHCDFVKEFIRHFFNLED